MRVKEETMAILKQLDVGNKLASSLPVLHRASVLTPLTVKNGRLFTLMTLRSRELRTSAGEVCFPGRGTPVMRMTWTPRCEKHRRRSVYRLLMTWWSVDWSLSSIRVVCW